MANAKVEYMLNHVSLEKPKDCPGFYCMEMNGERYPCDGTHYDSATGSVPTFVCFHLNGQCRPNAETEYFLLKCLALGKIDVVDFNLLYPVKGDRNRFVPNFSDDDVEGCVGFEIVSGRSRVEFIERPGILQAPFDYHPISRKIHTTPCMHVGDCDKTTAYQYALMTACVINPTLLVKEDVDCYHFFKTASWVRAYSHFLETEGMRWQDVLADARCWPASFFGTGEGFFWTPDSLVLPKFTIEEAAPTQPPPPPPPPSPPRTPSPPPSGVVRHQPAPLASPIPGPSGTGGKNMNKYYQQYKDILKDIGLNDTVVKKEVNHDDAFDDDQDAFLLSLIEVSENAVVNDPVVLPPAEAPVVIPAAEAPGSVQSGDTVHIRHEHEPMDVDDSPIVVDEIKQEPVEPIAHCSRSSQRKDPLKCIQKKVKQIPKKRRSTNVKVCLSVSSAGPTMVELRRYSSSRDQDLLMDFSLANEGLFIIEQLIQHFHRCGFDDRKLKRMLKCRLDTMQLLKNIPL